MRIFITGTDTSVGKTLISAWLCAHTGYRYFKPIQSGACQELDSCTVQSLSGCHIYKETYVYPDFVSPHLAAHLAGETIDLARIQIPHSPTVIVEGAGGVLTPITPDFFIADLIAYLHLPVIVVARSGLGTINHTLLTLEALRAYSLTVLGVIVNGETNSDNVKAIEHYGRVPVLAQFPKLMQVSAQTLKEVPFSSQLQELFAKK